MRAVKRLAMLNSDGKSGPPLADPAGIETTLVELRLRTLARSPYDRLFTDLATVDAAEAAVRTGCDGIYIDTFADYGIEAIRTIVDVPVVGAGEASIRAAASHGRFSIVTVWPESMGYLYDERLRDVPGGDSCIDVHHFSREEELDRAGTSTGIKARMTRGEHRLVEQLVECCRRVAAADDCAAILLGCTCMSPVHTALQQACDLPVLDPSATGLQAAFEILGDDPPVSGRARSRRAGDVPLLLDAWLRQGPADVESEVCDVCIVADES